MLYCYKKNTNLKGLSAQSSSASGAVIQGFGLGLLPPLCPNPFRVLGAMARYSMLLLLWLLLALWVEGASRRRARAVARADLPSETEEDATALAPTAARVPASSSSAVSSNEAPLEVIRLEDGTVLVERRGNFAGPPPPMPVEQPVASDIAEEAECEDIILRTLNARTWFRLAAPQQRPRRFIDSARPLQDWKHCLWTCRPPWTKWLGHGQQLPRSR